MQQAYDYAIAGAGSAGCVVDASALREQISGNPGATVIGLAERAAALPRRGNQRAERAAKSSSLVIEGPGSG